MKRPMLLTIIALSLGVSTIQAKPAHYPPCGDRQPPNQSSAFCRPRFIGGELVGVHITLPFAWIRSAPSSDASVLITMLPDSNPTLRIVHDTDRRTHWDGYQWWWQVASLAQRPELQGWLEQAALRDMYPTDSTPYMLADWQPPLTVRVEAGLRFLWLRDAPASNAPLIAVIPARSLMTISGDPQFDGVQWWWRATYITTAGAQTGYVEQSLIEPI